MTAAEYHKKYEAIAVSDADISVKEAALAKLSNQYNGAIKRALSLIEESKPELKPGELK